MNLYENPDRVPLEELKLNIKNDGIIIAINALDAKWAENRYFLRYEQPKICNDDGSEIIGAKENWLEMVGYINKDLNWLLNLPFYRFWSNIVYNTSIIDALVSFLQEAPPFYALENFPNISEMLEALEELCRNVLMIFVRLTENKESLTEYMHDIFLGNLLYDNYIFTIPIIFDLCQLYGRENTKVIRNILCKVFNMQPLYNNDLENSVPYLIKALKNVQWRFEDCPVDATEAVALSDRGGASVEITLYDLESLILYVLDVISTVTVLLKNYPSLTSIFHGEDFTNKILSVYESTIPEMYRKLDKLAYNDENMPKYMELKHRLDVTRVEMLNLYRIIIYEPISKNMQEKAKITESEIRNCTEKYISSLMNAISRQEFIVDYHRYYPINVDLETLSRLCPEVDTEKCNYILDSLHLSIGNDKMSVNESVDGKTPATTPGPSGVQNNQQKGRDYDDASCTNNRVKSTLKDLVSEVKEILNHCGEGFIERCLKHYNSDVESVINAIFEDNLPPALQELDKTLPYIPPDPMERSAIVDTAIGSQRLNIYDNDEFDVMTRDNIDTSKIHRGKKKDKYKDATEMLNDKSEIKNCKNFYDKFNFVPDDEDDYNDEYDDTYDSCNIRTSGAIEDSTDTDVRPFTVPRVFCTNDKNDTSSEEVEAEIEDEKSIRNKDHFIQNPAEIRAKFAQRKQSARGGKSAHGAVGKSTEQEQSKDNKYKKNVNKASQGNHNRRIRSEWKRRQGMIPS